jgi:Tol biopolymer transport system component
MNTSPSVTPDGRYIVFTSNRGGVRHIWKANIDGSNPMQLTDGPGEGWTDCSPDGRWVVYDSAAGGGPQSVWKVPTDGGKPVEVTRIISALPTFSPDGKLLAGRCQGGPTGEERKICAISFDDGRLIKEFAIQPTTIIWGDYKALSWTPDGGGLAYIDTRTGVPNIWARPLDGGPEKQLTDFKTDQVFGFDWSRDGKRLAVTRGTITKDVILFSGLK